MNIINGKQIQEQKLKFISKNISKIKDTLKLVVIQVGDNEASNVYIKNKQKICEKVGILFEHIKYDKINEAKLIERIEELNTDKSVTGILVQLPLPKDINEKRVIDAIHPLKDVDGLTTVNLGNLFSGNKGLVPCTALGVLEILKSINAPIEGSNVVIVGRSRLVGLPLSGLLLRENATVTICHSKTKDLKEKTKQADILIVAIGKKQLIKESYIKENAIVIDVGINREEGKLYGDCDFENIKDKCNAITPVPNGVGPLTVTMLINNIIEAYNLQKNN